MNDPDHCSTAAADYRKLQTMRTDPNIADPDAFYERLVNAYTGLSDEQCADLDARLLLLLANQVGDDGVIATCIEAARRSVMGVRVEDA